MSAPPHSRRRCWGYSVGVLGSNASALVARLGRQEGADECKETQNSTQQVCEPGHIDLISHTLSASHCKKKYMLHSQRSKDWDV